MRNEIGKCNDLLNSTTGLRLKILLDCQRDGGHRMLQCGTACASR